MSPKTIMNYSKLRGRIVEKYGNMSNFAKELRVSRQNVSFKLSGKRNHPFSQKDIIQWCEALDIPLEEAYLYFFENDVNVHLL